MGSDPIFHAARFSVDSRLLPLGEGTMAVNPYAELATRRQRLAANALDAFILALIILPAAFVVPAIDGFGVLVASSMLVLASAFVASTNLWLLASHGAT